MKVKAILPLVVMVLMSSIVTVSVQAQECPYAGLTPGFWKNRGLRLGLWPDPYDPDDPFADYFNNGPFGIDTLIMALRAGGGDGIEGAKRILARAAVAALLNRAYFVLPGVYGEYRYTKGQITNMVNAAFASGDRDTMISLAEDLDYWNNMGVP